MESSSPYASSSTSSRHIGQSNPAASPRPRPAPRSSSSAFQSSRSSGYAPPNHRRAASSSSLLHSMASSSFSTGEASPIRRRIPPSLPQEPESPRFSHLLTSVLGSPFLTTTDLPTNASGVEMDTLDPCLNRRAASPTPSVDFSIIDVDPDDPDALHFSTNASIPGGYPFRRSRHWAGHSRSFSTSVAGMKLSRSYAHDTSRGSSEYNHHSFASGLNESRPSTPPKQGTNLQGSLKSLLPRIWDVLSSPGRAVMNFSPTASVNSNSLSGSSSTSSSRTNSPSPRRPLTPISQSWYHATAPEVAKPPWNVSRHKKSRSRTTGFFSRNGSRGDLSLNVNYSELDPLDGDEGELIDDEACFIDVRAVTGIDVLALLPPELALHILMLLCPPPLDYSSTSTTLNDTSTEQGKTTSSNSASQSPAYSGAGSNASYRSPLTLSSITDQEVALHAILACRSVSHTWRRLASDNAVWHALFLGHWGVNLERATPEAVAESQFRRPGRMAMGCTWDYDWGTNHSSFSFGHQLKGKQPIRHTLTPKINRREDNRHRSLFLAPRRISYITTSENTKSLSSAPLQLDWRMLYRERLELDNRWAGTVHSNQPRQKSSPSYMELSDPALMEGKENIKPWEPALRRMKGHTDSVYCLEFDSQRIMTGSRDRTIKVWSLKTGQVLGTFRGVHRGSVLCLKFERDWDRYQNAGGDSLTSSGSSGTKKLANRKGMLVTGSSDCSICVWDLELGDLIPGTSDREVKAEVRATLKGHEGGVLDLRMDEKWIVSCSKDASIRVWDRDTLESVRVLRGHEGPVNAIGFQDDKVVSASGDGKMILWDVTNGERIRTFEGHDRGLACIEYKDNLIVSGSNDCKIKVWNPWTGECLRTLVGHDSLVRALSFDPRTGRLVSVSYDRTVKVWDLRTGKLVREFDNIHASHIFDVKFDINRIVTTSHDHQIIDLDFSEGLDTSFFI